MATIYLLFPPHQTISLRNSGAVWLHRCCAKWMRFLGVTRLNSKIPAPVEDAGILKVARRELQTLYFVTLENTEVYLFKP